MVAASKKLTKVPKPDIDLSTSNKTESKIKKKNITKLGAVPKLTRVQKKTKKPRDPESLSSFIALSNLPHGFFEEQIIKYFSQYGKVTKVRGGFSGMAFVGFQHPEVAGVVTTVMDKSIMMRDKVVKCRHLKEKEVPKHLRYGGFIGPKKVTRTQILHQKLDQKYSQMEIEDPLKVHEYLQRTLTKVKEQGIDYSFDYSKKLDEVLKNESKRLDKKKKKTSEWLQKDEVKKVAEKHGIEVGDLS
ncbi:hypothetical protein FO519_006943 [Halicephalobus sp. NKZ332]|nr:hypothetical protein FO519_006943 [Halicephalobus sp. NKZ332]